MELKFIIFFFVMLLSLYDVISCGAINVKNFHEIFMPLQKNGADYLQTSLEYILFLFF